ncbi:MAG: ribosome assembly RNA-binding protein YhbY [Succinivibrionaceae bacterium]|nr:ribosome assembly RNA-binding protein YhbY [Ruminobacter sp.]MDY5778731.1 ribosome assembly RNA-binding protein YhbY [Succinivibrionaceae bacterium]MEE1340301.1 ribosome assembly RNA-binding protein YhbY [Succinivibrionaceae bacterium]
MELTTKQKLYLRNKAHDLKPVVMLGKKGLADTVIAEIISSVEHHELIKVKVALEDKEQKDAVAEEIAKLTQTEVVQFIGNNLILFKQAKKKSKFSLPKE